MFRTEQLHSSFICITNFNQIHMFSRKKHCDVFRSSLPLPMYGVLLSAPRLREPPGP